ncbi:MAG: hypothetical protein AB7K71_33045 [Polyangiaceae bacterium]
MELKLPDPEDMGWVKHGLLLACGVLALASCDSAVTSGPSAAPASKPGTRLSAIVLEAEGVHTPPQRWFDTLLKVECDFYQTGENYHCLPDSAWIVYADPECTQPLLEVDDSVPENTPVVGLGDEPFGHCGETLDGKPLTLRAFMAGKELPPRTVYGPFDCKPSESHDTLREVVEEMPMDRFVSAKSVTLPIEGRFDAKVLYADDGTRDYYALYDRKLETNVSASLGVFQPTYTSDLREAFSDEACSQSIGPADTYCSADYASQNVETDGCTMTAELWKLAKTGEKAYELVGSEDNRTCQKTYYPALKATKQVAWSTLARSDRRVDGDGRIRTVWDRALGGSADLRWYSLFDSKFGLDCYLSSFGNDLYRCVPRSTRSREFLDADCATPIIPEQGCVEIMSSFGGSREGWFRIADRETIGHHYESTTSGGCERVDDEAPRTVLVAGEQITRDELATGQRRTLDANEY